MSREYRIRQKHGSSAIIVLQMFVVAVLFGLMAINLANIQRQQSASQISSDLASRWGVDLVSRTDDEELIEQQVKEIAQRNWTVYGNKSEDWLEQNEANIDVDIQLGSVREQGGKLVFHPGKKPTNAVRVNNSRNTQIYGFNNRTHSGMEISRSSTSVAIERDLCLVIDRSGSMNFDLDTGTWSYDTARHNYNPLSTSRHYYYQARAYQWWWYWPHPENSRWSTMLPAIHGLAQELNTTSQNEQFSIVSYSTESDQYVYTHGYAGRTRRYRANDADIEVQPTGNYDEAADFIENRYQWEQPVMGGTNISAGIDLAAEVLTGSRARPNAFKTMIVMTDGQYNSGRAPWLAAEDAAELGIEVYTVTFSRQADQRTMQLAAEAGSGKHFHAPDGDSLEEIFRAIANIPPAALIE